MIALDTNVLIYACNRGDSRRQEIAIDIVTPLPQMADGPSLRNSVGQSSCL